MIGHILQLNENKLTLHLLGKIMNLAVEEGILSEADFMTKAEAEIIGILDKELSQNPKTFSKERSKLARLYKTFRTMTKIEHTQTPLDENEYFCINLKVKQRYINPLVKTANSCTRISETSSQAKKIIEDFLLYNDTPFGCVKLINA